MDIVEKIRLMIKNDMILYRMIAVFSMISTLVILLLTTVIFSLFGSEIKHEIYRSQEQSLKQISNTVSFRAEYVNSLMLQAKEDEMISKLFYLEDDSQLSAIKNRMNDYRAPVRQLNSIYVYSQQSDRIYYSGENGLPFINSRLTFDDEGFIEILEHIEEYPKYTPILRKMSVEWPAGREYETYVYTYLLYDTYGSGSIKNILAFNFHLGWMEDALNFITSGQNTSEEIWIINSDREIVYTNSGKLIGVTCDQSQLSDEVFSQESGYFLSGSGNDRQMIVYATPSRMGYEEWTFISWNDYANLMKPLDQVRKTIYAFCGIVFTISLLIVFRVSHFLYQPVLSTINRVKALEAENDKKRKIERMLFLRKLFLGDIADDIQVIQKLFAQHQIDSRLDEDIRVILISVDDKNAFISNYGKQMDEVSEKMEAIIYDHFQGITSKLLSVRMHTGMWAVCIPANKDICIESAVFEKLNQQLLEKMEVSINMSVSSAGHSIRDIPYLYSEAVNVHSYSFLWGKNKLITYEDTKLQGQSRYEYPNEIEKRLLSHLFGGKYAESIEDYEAFIAAVRRFSVEEIRLSCMLLAYAIKSASQKSMAEATGMLVEFDRFYKKIQTAENISEVHDMYHRLIREITDKLKKSSKERHEVMIGQIENYVEKHYGDINLSMNEISDHVNMSSAYLGRLFKQVTGNTFSEYLTRFRLNKACALLRNTDLTVNEISDQVGFTNSSYFYIIFKKNLECTPNQYRKQFGNDASD